MSVKSLVSLQEIKINSLLKNIWYSRSYIWLADRLLTNRIIDVINPSLVYNVSYYADVS